MKLNRIVEENRAYTFADYFKLPYPTRDVVAEFGYTFKLEKLDLPTHQGDRANVERLRTAYYRKLPAISLNSEAAKREFLVSPLLLELLDYVEFAIDVEYPLYVSEQLKGTVDYWLYSSQALIVIEAKNADLDRGFTQLAVELIAVDRSLGSEDEPERDRLYGAVTTGNLWQFGVLIRSEKKIAKQIDILPLPANLAEIFAILLGILQC